MTEKNKKYGVAEVMEHFRLFQSLQYLLLCIVVALITMAQINYVFVAGDINYRCQVPECESQPPQYSASWYPAGVDRCQRPTLTAGGVCSNTSFSRDLETCTSWVYETNNTIVADLNLACDPWRVSLVGTVRNAGMLFANVGAGWLSDKYGRKTAVLICSILCCVGLFKTLTTNYAVYLAIELLESLLSGGLYTPVVVFVLELASRKMRLASGIIFAYSIYLGECIFVMIAMFVPYWKYLIYIVYFPSLLFIFFFFLLKESPRWLVLNGRYKEALENLKLTARVNGLQIDENDFDKSEEQIKDIFNISSNAPKDSFADLVKSRVILKRLVIGCVAKFTASFVYYGLTINSVFLPGDKYINFLLSSLMPFLGNFIAFFAMGRFGRKIPLMVGYVLAGVFCVGSAFVPLTYNWAKILLYLLGKMMISSCYTGAVTYTMELFPTSARGLLLGVCALCAQIGAILAPMTPILATVTKALPSVLFAGFTILTAGLLSLNPETRDMPLLNTIAQVNANAAEQKEQKRNKKEEKDLERNRKRY